MVRRIIIVALAVGAALTAGYGCVERDLGRDRYGAWARTNSLLAHMVSACRFLDLKTAPEPTSRILSTLESFNHEEVSITDEPEQWGFNRTAGDTVLDAFGHPIRMEPDAAHARRVRLISAGPDGDHDDVRDNIVLTFDLDTYAFTWPAIPKRPLAVILDHPRRLFRIAAVLATYPAVAFIGFICGTIRRCRRRRMGLCIKCGYDLTGNVSGVCPECGEQVDRR